MHIAIIHIGSNQGNRKSYLSKCRFLLSERVGTITKRSQIYKTEAWGVKNQQDFLNQAFEIHTSLALDELLAACQSIESLLNRKRDIKWGPRTIDIDIIFYDEVVVSDEIIQVPHPRMQERNFVLYPLSEIIPDFVHPVLLKSVLELKNNSKDSSYVSL